MGLYHHYLPNAQLVRRHSGGLAMTGNDANTTVLLHMDGADAATTFTDSNAGGSAHEWTAAGNAQIDTAESKFGGASGLFDGNGDAITTTNHADFDMGTGDFTIDCWFNRSGGNGASRFMAQLRSSITSCAYLSLNTSNQLQGVINLPNLGDKTIAGATTITATGWHHAALVRHGGNMYLFLDGVSEGSLSDLSTEAVRDSDLGMTVGASGGPSSSYWFGWIDEVRLSKGLARWTTGFTPPTGAYGP
jgi:hypothetical protein